MLVKNMTVELVATAASLLPRHTAPALFPSQGRGVSAGVDAAWLGKRRIHTYPHDSATGALTV